MDSFAGDVQSIKLRSYQEEMLDSCLKHNVIIVMDTGSGKTQIAVRRIAEELKSTPKIVWFMCPSVALCMQQYGVLAEQLPGYLIKTLTGGDEVDKWTTQPLWDGFLENVRVVVCTPKILEDALTHGFVKIPSISLLVFDEAHRCIKDAPMNVIMRDSYHHAKAKGTEDLPHVLGLTASPVMSAKSSSLETIEANLDAKAITPKIHRTELERYVYPPQVIPVNFVPSQEGGQYSYLCQALKRIFDSYDTSTEPLRCYKQLKGLHQRANTLNEQLGRSAAEWYVTQWPGCVSENTTDSKPAVLWQSSLGAAVVSEMLPASRHATYLVIGTYADSSDCRYIKTCAQKYMQLEVYQSELFIEVRISKVLYPPVTGWDGCYLLRPAVQHMLRQMRRKKSQCRR